MNLSRKLLLAIGLPLLLAVAAGLFGIAALTQSVARYQQIIDTDKMHMRKAGEMLTEFKTQVQEWKNVLLRGKDPKQLDRYWSAFQQQESKVAALARELQADLPAGEAKTLVARFAFAHEAMGKNYRQGFESFKAANFDHTAGDAAVKGMDREPAKLIDEVVAMIDQNARETAAAAQASSRMASIISVVLMLATCVVGAIVAALIARSITVPLQHALSVAKTVASGDLSTQIDVKSKDETGELLAALATMNESLLQVVLSVRDSSDSIATGSTQIATGSADISKRTEKQAANLQQAAASMEQLTVTVKQNSGAAQEASALAISTRDAAASGAAVVNQVVQTMHEISASSRKIGDIIGVIDEIAFQTNILALNASVEAARAGDQGRGFSVVAAEVRSLAQRSAAAAREIKTLIGASVDRVEAGSKLVDDAGKSMEDIVARIKRVTDLITEISAAGQQQSRDITQVGGAVSQLDQVIQQNAALVEQSSAAADSLKQEAARLVAAVSLFKLRERAGTTATAFF